MVECDASFRGREIPVPAGEDLRLTLAEPRTSGFRWKAEDVPDSPLDLTGDDYSIETSRPGAAGNHMWVYHCSRPGRAELAFRLQRPWQATDPPADRFTLVVVVTPVNS